MTHARLRDLRVARACLPSRPFRLLSRKFLRHIAAALLLTTALSACPQPKASEYDVKAAYLFNFGKFIRTASPTPVQAPPTDRRTFDICILGNDPVGAALESLTANEQIDRRPVRIRRFNEVIQESPLQSAQIRSCDIAYIGDDAQIESDLGVLRNADVLTVSDSPSFLNHGGMIQFVTVANHVRFAVNLDAVHRTHLVLSSELLRVASRVVDAHEVLP